MSHLLSFGGVEEYSETMIGVYLEGYGNTLSTPLK